MNSKHSFQCNKLLNRGVKTADSVAYAFSVKKYEIFFDNSIFRPIISAFKDLLSGVITTANGVAPRRVHLGLPEWCQ